MNTDVMDDMMAEAWAGYVGLAVRNGAFAFSKSLTCADLAQFVAGYDMIVAVYADATAPTGLYFLPVKGWDLWKRVAEGVVPRDIRTNSIPCVDRNAAVALLKRFGDPAWLEEFGAPSKVTTN
jgi:hypothetical protein